jgi:hypothetical protein
MGIAYANNVYVKNESQKPYVHRGCFKDDETRLVPIYLNDVSTVE